MTLTFDATSSWSILFWRPYHSFSCRNRAISSSCAPWCSLWLPRPSELISELRPNLLLDLPVFFSRRLTPSSSGLSSSRFDAEPKGLLSGSCVRIGVSSNGLLFWTFEVSNKLTFNHWPRNRPNPASVDSHNPGWSVHCASSHFDWPRQTGSHQLSLALTPGTWATLHCDWESLSRAPVGREDSTRRRNWDWRVW